MHVEVAHLILVMDRWIHFTICMPSLTKQGKLFSPTHDTTTGNNWTNIYEWLILFGLHIGVRLRNRYPFRCLHVCILVDFMPNYEWLRPLGIIASGRVTKSRVYRERFILLNDKCSVPRTCKRTTVFISSWVIFHLKLSCSKKVWGVDVSSCVPRLYAMLTIGLICNVAWFNQVNFSMNNNKTLSTVQLVHWTYYNMYTYQYLLIHTC
jgi:hypothetical protein